MNDKKLKQIHLLFRVIFITAAALILLFLVWRDVVPGGVLKVEYNLSQNSPFINRLWPPGRVLAIEERDSDFIQRMVGDPVYVDVKTPRHFREATFELTFQKPAEQSLSIGLLTSADPWRVDIQPLEISESGNWQVGQANFFVRNSYQDNKLKFLLSAPELDANDREILITGVKVRFTKEPLTWRNAFTKLMDYFVSKFVD